MHQYVEPASLVPPLVYETVGRDISDQIFERLAYLEAGASPIDVAVLHAITIAFTNQSSKRSWGLETTQKYDHDGNGLQRQIAPYVWLNGPRQSFFQVYLAEWRWPELMTGLMIVLGFLMMSHVLYPVVPKFGFRSTRGIVTGLFMLSCIAAAIFIPNASPILATACPIWPRPIRPNVLPANSPIAPSG